MRVGKAQKGQNKETPEMRRIRNEKKMFAEQMLRKQQQEVKKLAIKERLHAEVKAGRMNRRKIVQNWRRLLQPNKLEELKGDIDILQKNYERALDRRDTQIRMLDRDLLIAENKHKQADEEYVKRGDILADIQQGRRRALDEQFTTGLEIIKTEFERERVEIVTKHMRDKRFLGQLMWEMQQEWNDVTAVQTNDFTERKNQQETVAEEEKNQVRFQLESLIEHLVSEIDKLRRRSRVDTLEMVEDFEKVRRECNDDDDAIKKNANYNNRKKRELDEWKLKILNTSRECSERNNTLREEREAMNRHFHDLKSKMLRVREQEKSRLAELIHCSRDCIDSLKTKLEMGERIFKLAELNRKMESEREKLLPYYPSTVQVQNQEDDEEDEELLLEPENQGLLKRDEWQPSAIAGTQASDRDSELQKILPKQDRENDEAFLKLLQPTALQPNGAPLRESEYLDNFFKRYNKVKLDKIALTAEKQRLAADNALLRATLKQYLDGISVNQDVLSNPNALFMTGPMSLFRRDEHHAGPDGERTRGTPRGVVVRPVVEAAVVAQTANFAARVAQRTAV